MYSSFSSLITLDVQQGWTDRSKKIENFLHWKDMDQMRIDQKTKKDRIFFPLKAYVKIFRSSKIDVRSSQIGPYLIFSNLILKGMQTIKFTVAVLLRYAHRCSNTSPLICSRVTRHPLPISWDLPLDSTLLHSFQDPRGISR